jgi:tRNA/rRNA methyltransferase
MSNFGFMHLRVVNPYEIAYGEARSAVNASYVLSQSQQYHTVAEAVADCTLVVGTSSIGPRALTHPLRRLEFGGRQIREASESGPVALLFGCEKFGLSNEDLAHCHWLLRIPTRVEHHSMNLGQAVAVCLYELIRSEEEEKREPTTARAATAGEIQRLGDLLIEALGIAGYTQERTATSSEQKIRRMLNRMSLTRNDSQIWLGMLRQLLWKLRQ